MPRQMVGRVRGKHPQDLIADPPGSRQVASAHFLHPGGAKLTHALEIARFHPAANSFFLFRLECGLWHTKEIEGWRSCWRRAFPERRIGNFSVYHWCGSGLIALAPRLVEDTGHAKPISTASR
jgi:hypothetical protein